MADKNYKLIYEIMPFREALMSANQAVARANLKVKEAERNFTEACAKLSGVKVEDLLFSNEGCMARGILHHVYHIKVKAQPHGHHENKCIFCGINNVSDLY